MDQSEKVTWKKCPFALGPPSKQFLVLLTCYSIVVIGLYCVGYFDSITHRLVQTRRIASNDEDTDSILPCQDRISKISEICLKRGWFTNRSEINRGFYKQLIVDDAHKVIYCPVPKVGCSTFKQLMVQSTGKIRNGTRPAVHSPKMLRKYGLSVMKDFNMGGIAHRLNTYNKFIVVRHPFDRLQSAFTDKFVQGTYYPRKYASLSNITFGANVKWDPESTPRLTIEQFLELVVAEYGREFKNYHWVSYYDFCRPCDIKYDAVLKLETAEYDTGTILEWLQLPKDLIGHRNRQRDTSSTSKLAEVTKKFTNINSTLIKGLMKIYARDFELFDYSWDSIKGAQCSNPANSSCC